MQVSRTAPISAIPVRSPSHGSEGSDWPGGPLVAGRVGSSFPLTPCSGRRGRRFKSGHPDKGMAGHKASSGLPAALRAPGCPILGAHWERTQVTEGRPQPADRKRNRRGASPRRGSSCDRQHPGTLARCMATWDMSGLKTDGATASLDRVPGLGIPAIRGAGRQDGEPGGRPGKEQKRKEEDDEQTPTPGAALGLRPPRRRSGRKGGRRAGLFTCQPRAVEDQCRLAVTAARTAAMTADNACRVWTTVEYRPNAQTTVGRSWMMCPLLRNRWSGRTS